VTGQLGIDGETQPERVCACGCGRSLEGKRRDAVWASRACAVRWARSNPGRPSGLQVSYRKAVAVLADWLAVPPTDGCTPHPEEILAEEILRDALPRRQQQILKQRERRLWTWNVAIFTDEAEAQRVLNEVDLTPTGKRRGRFSLRDLQEARGRNVAPIADAEAILRQAGRQTDGG
jgi:hypothetical protein